VTSIVKPTQREQHPYPQRKDENRPGIEWVIAICCTPGRPADGIWGGKQLTVIGVNTAINLTKVGKMRRFQTMCEWQRKECSMEWTTMECKVAINKGLTGHDK